MEYILTKEYGPIIEKCFASDPELLSTYHIAAGSGVEGCVRKTMDDLALCDPSFRFYEIVDGKKNVGFFGTELIGSIAVLTTIFVYPKYRTKNILPKVWKLIDGYFGSKVFIAGLYARNTRCMEFYRKNGGIEIDTPLVNDHPATIFIFNVPKKEEVSVMDGGLCL